VKSSSTLMRNVVPVAALLFLLATIPMAQLISASTRNNESLTLTAPRQNQTQKEGTYPFEFHSGFWMNLHHFLYEQALLRRRSTGSGQTANKATNPKSQLSAGQQQLWDAALDYYAKMIIKRDLLFDDGMIVINDQLGESEGATDLSKSGLPGDLIKILESVAALYRERWWPEHDRTNHFWIAAVTPLVRQFGRTLINQLTAAYKAKWPAGLVRVEVVEYANWAGAYTTFDRAQRVHSTISTDPGNQGFAALEILFHEASHSMVFPRSGAVAEAIARECQAKNKPVPRDLWHAIIFYTAGEFIRRDLGEYRVNDYTPYAYRGLYARAWPNLQRPLELYWQPYLNGTVDFDKAISNLINAL
jgi:hypothetical protein